ncbi:hypothetical protein [Mucilaginibacter pineti]|nr:hypothetical protein [Mucilaginibacter pineti]
MRYTPLFILLLTALPFFCFAQKAYELECYSGKLNGKTIRLDLANGFIGATQIVIPRKSGLAPVIYYANSGTPETNNTMLFQSKYLQKKDYFILDNMKEAYEDLPRFITGKYYFRKQLIKVKFLFLLSNCCSFYYKGSAYGANVN